MLLQLPQLRIAQFALITGLSFIFIGCILTGKYYENRLLPETYIENINVSGKTKNEVVALLQEKYPNSDRFIGPEEKFSIVVDTIKVQESAQSLGLRYNYEAIVTNIFEKNQNSGIFRRAIQAFRATRSDYKIEPEYTADSIQALVESIAEKVDIQGAEPNISLKISNTPNSLVVFRGEPARAINQAETTQKIITAINNGEITTEAVVASPSTPLTSNQVEEALISAQALVGKQLVLTVDDMKFSLTDKEIVSLLRPPAGFNTTVINELITTLKKEFNRPSTNAEFTYNPETLKVTTFIPHTDGLEVQEKTLQEQFPNWLTELSNLDETEKKLTVTLPTTRKSPEITLDATNNLGIIEKIGFGESQYEGSIPNRIHNVGITSDKISLTIVPPKTEFSFNKTVGEISSKTGYKSAYVISGGRTVLGDGGGVCQVSSTLFRAVLDAGLDITKRLQHSYRVSYYELNSDPGFDATVYSGAVDFKFINDTENHILIQSTANAEKKYMSITIYGTSDGRTTEISDYKKWDARPPLPTEYYPSTELPSGKLKQIDWAVGGIKTEFTHTIKNKDGSIRKKSVYYSNYRPWAAKYLRGV